MEGFLWFIFIVIIVGFLFRFFAPLLLKWFIKRSYKNINQKETGCSKKEGETEISGKKPEATVSKDVGEYVDYENIEH